MVSAGDNQYQFVVEEKLFRTFNLHLHNFKQYHIQYKEEYNFEATIAIIVALDVPHWPSPRLNSV